MEFVIVALAWFLGGIVGGATGIGGTMIAMPLLTFATGPAMAILISILVGLLGTMQIFMGYRKFCSFREIRDLVIGCLPGCVVGSLVLKIASVQYLQFMISAMLVCFVLLQMFRKAAVWRLPDSTAIGLGAGGVCGFVGSSVGMVGAPLGIYALLKHWEPDRARGNMGAFGVAVSLASVASQACAGLYSLDILPNVAAGFAGCFAGSVLGVRLGRRISHVLFHRILIGFLIVSAVILFVRAV